ncbi:MAG: discoidin domain-containing protein, partial [Chthonomonadales bacterium]
QVVRECQPNAVIFSDAGPDIRWVGNENGRSNPTNWAMLRRDEFFPGTPRSAELTSGHEDGNYWVPAECDVSIRPGWFFRDSETPKLKSVRDLMNIYYASVGRNGSLLLNVPANKDGLIAPEDVQRLKEFREARDLDLQHDLAAGKRVTSTSVRKNSPLTDPKNVTGSREGTYWAAKNEDKSANIEIYLGGDIEFNCIRLREEISLGQRVEEFEIDARVAGTWVTHVSGTTIGNCRILKTPVIRADRIRVKINKSRACPVISRVSVFKTSDVPWK